jgi:AraC-like DNA-binding protein
MNIQIPIFDSIRDVYDWTGLSAECLVSEDFTIQQAPEWRNNEMLKMPEVYRANFFTIFFINEGTAGHRYNEEVLELETNSIFVTAPGHYRNYALDNVKNARFICFTEKFISNYCFSDIYNEYPFLLSEAFIYTKLDTSDTEEIQAIVAEIEKEIGVNSVIRPYIIGNLLEFLLLKIKSVLPSDLNISSEGSKNSLVINAFYKDLDKYLREILKGNNPKELKAKDFAELQYLNEDYFSKLIKSKTGRTPAAWINSRILSEAKTLLTETTLPIAEIAIIFQFSSSRYFNLYFKKQTTMTPSKYRKSLHFS